MQTIKILKNKCIDKYGNVFYNDEQIIELIYNNCFTDEIVAVESPNILKYNKETISQNETPIKIYKLTEQEIEDFDKENQTKWFVPKEYYDIDLYQFLLEKCKNQKQINRLNEEWVLFQERNLEDVLRFFIYFVDTLRKNKIFWGIGRGSSVASFVLYLIGVHKINPIQYDLNIRDFLK